MNPLDYAYVGSYTTLKRGGLGCGGISVFAGTSGGQWKKIQTYEIMNPSFLTFGRNKRNLYAVRADGDIVTAFAIEERTSRIEYLNEKHIGFNNGVFVTTDAKSRYLFVASCSNSPGAVVSIRLKEDGSLGEICDIVIPHGETGPLRPAQNGVRPHQVCFDRDGEYLIEVDKGLDQLNTFCVDYESGRMTQVASVNLPQSCCPRHVAFHPTKPLAYLLTEWIGRIITCSYENGIFKPLQIVNTTPDSFVGVRNVAAEIAVHPSGRFVYASNRGDNSIAAFSVRRDGLLSSIGWYREGVAKPRFFTISEDGAHLYCANEESHNVTLFEIQKEDGTLRFSDTVMQASAPACILFSNQTHLSV